MFISLNGKGKGEDPKKNTQRVGSASALSEAGDIVPSELLPRVHKASRKTSLVLHTSNVSTWEVETPRHLPLGSRFEFILICMRLS